MILTPQRRLALAGGFLLPLALLGCDPAGADVDFGGAEDTAGSASTEPEDVPYGPDNTWYHAMSSEVPEGLEGSGRSTGDTAYNFTLLDQFGNEVELYQFYGQVIVIDAFAEW